MAIFMILILYHHEHEMFLHLFVFSLISLSSGLKFSLKRSFTSFVSVFLGIFSLCSSCEWEFTLYLALFKSFIGELDCLWFLVFLKRSFTALVSCIPRYFILFLAIVNGSSLIISLFVCYWCIGILVIFAH